ncbi:DUF4395 domain-containing protein [Bacillus gobiensis]|uniref:DUF4395 domain-containing protein n=1 Tax=Bacillus gobiensis TaxID=1441095 RepID=UPI003D256DDB
MPRPLVRTNQWVIVLSVLTAWIFSQPWFLAIPLISGLLGLFFGFNPIMRIAKLFLRNPASDYIPEERDQQQFNQVIAVICLFLGLIGFLFNLDVIGWLFTIMVALSAFIGILGFCIGCFIRFQWKRYVHRRT